MAYLPSSSAVESGQFNPHQEVGASWNFGHTGYLVTGGQDAIISVFSLDVAKVEPDFTLVGHTDNVCSLNTSSNGIILSGSWDK